MDRRTGSFPCQSCEKVYSTRASLIRHSQNHTKTNEKICPTCRVVFYRKDLLDRHQKMVHDYSVQDGNEQGSRKRCHTACINCRDARIKCDGSNPCASCRASCTSCVYSATSARVSSRNARTKMVEEDETLTSSHLEGSLDAPMADDSSFMSLQTTFEGTSAGASVSGAAAVQIMSTQPAAIDDFDFADLPSRQTIAWPWLHEDLFLQQTDGWTGFEPSFPEGSHLADDEIAASLSRVGQDLGAVADNAITQYTHPNNMALTHGFVPQASTMAPQPQRAMKIADEECNHHYGNRRFELNHSSNPAFTSPEILSLSNGIGSKTGGNRVRNIQTALTTELIAYARQASSESTSTDNHVTYWCSMSMRVREAFDMFSDEGSNTTSTVHCLDHLVQLYWENFSKLWPMISAYSFDTNSISPILYLTLSSIGAIYGGARASHFGVMLHEGLRDLLCEPMLSADDMGSNSLALAQARLLTQVAALYFGQRRAFTYAQHLGSILIAQTRRMGLFSPYAYQHELATVPSSTKESPENSRWLAHWLLAESRKRTAFGVLRAQVYTSVLLSSRPMLGPEEMDIELPCSNYLWLTKFEADSQLIAAIRQDKSSNMSEQLSFSDVVRITRERNEATGPLSILSHELLIFGLQDHVWRLCHDPDTFFRLTGIQSDGKEIYNGLDDTVHANEASSRLQNVRTRHHHHGPNSKTTSDPFMFVSRLTNGYRRMTDLRQENEATVLALYNWRQLSSTRNAGLDRSDRTSLMSGLLLFHVSFLRMYAPVEKLHHISYRVTSPTEEISDHVGTVWRWSQSMHAKVAVQHACIVWSLLFQECSRPADTRAWFNFLALLGLHHATVVIWSFAGTHPDEALEDESLVLTIGEIDGMGNKIPIISSKSRDLMMMFVKLYGHISPHWNVRSSFSAATARLANHDFPIQQK